MEWLNWLRWTLNFFELLACVTGFIYWKKIKETYWKYFPIYLVVIISLELTGKYLREIEKSIILNTNLYRFFGLPVQFLFFYWLIGKATADNKEKKWILAFCLIYITSCIIEILFLAHIKFWFSSFSYTVGNIILVAIIIRYFFKFINTEDIVHYQSSMIFWVIVGLLFFYLGTLPFFGLRNTLYYDYRDIFWIYSYIQLILDCIMYLFFTIAFIWGRPK